MAPFRNPFTKKPPPNGIYNNNDENAPPNTIDIPRKDVDDQSAYSSRASSNLSIKHSRPEPEEFKLGLVNTNGVYLPPSPPEKKSFWRLTPSSTHSTASTNHRSLLSDNEPAFSNISRESFESYRRSFDISARSPVTHPTDLRRGSSDLMSPVGLGRQSLDSYGGRPSPRQISYTSSINGRTTLGPASRDHNSLSNRVLEKDEDSFEEVGLGDNEGKPKKRGLFSRFGDGDSGNVSALPARPASSKPATLSNDENSRPSSSGGAGLTNRFHLLPGRKRGQSGQGAELAEMERGRSNSASKGTSNGNANTGKEFHILGMGRKRGISGKGENELGIAEQQIDPDATRKSIDGQARRSTDARASRLRDPDLKTTTKSDIEDGVVPGKIDSTGHVKDHKSKQTLNTSVQADMERLAEEQGIEIKRRT